MKSNTSTYVNQGEFARIQIVPTQDQGKELVSAREFILSPRFT